ncbi:NAD(P)-binding protein [Abortiporus biennis]|nr:NAD(P)-binding protein [Abortiporus biennis]
MGSTLSLFKSFVDQQWPPKPTFSVDQIPDLTGKVVIVIGGYAGVGKETVKALLNKNAKVYIAGRNKEKADIAVAELKTTTTGTVEPVFLELDLSSLKSVKKAAETFLSLEKELHILFNNAGVMWCPISEVTEDGYDKQFGTNVIGHWYFTELLIPALIAGKETSSDGYSRVITTSSFGAYLSTIDFDTLKDTPKRRKTDTHTLYYQTKFANVVVAKEVAQRYADKGILSLSCNPGNLKTELQRHVGWLEKLFINPILRPASFGALTQLWAGTMPAAVQYNGQFLVPWARPARCREEAYDPDLGKKLWDWLEEQVKEFNNTQTSSN